MDNLSHRQAVTILAALTTATGHRIQPPRGPLPTDPRTALTLVARRSGLRLHRIALPPGWCRVNLGPLLCWTASDHRPVPLVFRAGRYRRIDPETGRSRRLRPPEADALDRHADRVQVPLPAGGGIGRLMRRSVLDGGAELRRLVLASCVAAAFSLATPLVSGYVFGALLDGSGVAELSGLAVAYGVVAVLAGLLGVAANLRVLRWEGIVQHGAELPLWDALLRLPATFFADRGAGELADIAMSVSVTRDELSGLLVPLAGAACTIVFEFVLLLFVSPPMAGLAAALLVLAALVAAPLLVVAARHQREALPREFAMATLTQQLLAGIERIHLSAAQQRILCRWAERNQDAHRRVREVRWAHAVPDILAAALPVAGQVILFALVAGPMAGMLPTRQFFTVNAAFGLLFASASMLFSGCAIIVLVWPRLRWAGELVAAPRERQHVGADPGRLDGGVALHRIRFSYRSDGPPLIPELDIEVAPGEFVAVVGPSGSGKSTLLRLLLGFETPTSGQVCYDGADLSTLDLSAVRRQCGVVLQQTSLLAGTVRENIGGPQHDLRDVQRAVELAGLADEVAGWPMGLETVVSAGTSTVSVGQAQRILLARALVHRPRLLLLDEATSALDNRTQQVVVRNLASLRVTRIVVAHRLSTVRDADRILVLDRGRIVQQGTPRQLSEDQSGLFHQLARRQLLTEPEPTDTVLD